MYCRMVSGKKCPQELRTIDVTLARLLNERGSRQMDRTCWKNVFFFQEWVFRKEMSSIKNDSWRSRKGRRLLNERGQDRWIGHAGKCILLPRIGVSYRVHSDR
ncbi:hypothetical protein CEXT_780311 [Caerostris extrusa]|uniref:Uncharacterized protein n=1 Tax=Caerostris extrusa TaxID=172846 RepID=A0AAV4RD72_CAEEX|nr:hypothetical protein CEXT_780311 [Caerostris extrusa]